MSNYYAPSKELMDTVRRAHRDYPQARIVVMPNVGDKAGEVLAYNPDTDSCYGVGQQATFRLLAGDVRCFSLWSELEHQWVVGRD